MEWCHWVLFEVTFLHIQSLFISMSLLSPVFLVPMTTLSQPGTWNLVRRPLPQDMKLPRPAESISPHLLRLHNHPPQISTVYLIHCVPPTNPLINPFHPGLQPSTFCIHSKWTQTSVSQAFLHGVSLLWDFLIHFYLLMLQFLQGWPEGRSQTPWLIYHLLKNQKPYLFITNLTLMDEATICVNF